MTLWRPLPSTFHSTGWLPIMSRLLKVDTFIVPTYSFPSTRGAQWTSCRNAGSGKVAVGGQRHRGNRHAFAIDICKGTECYYMELWSMNIQFLVSVLNKGCSLNRSAAVATTATTNLSSKSRKDEFWYRIRLLSSNLLFKHNMHSGGRRLSSRWNGHASDRGLGRQVDSHGTRTCHFWQRRLFFLGICG